jgi:hypothetical protein
VVVENIARTNFGSSGDFVQQKGIADVHQSSIEIDGMPIMDLEIVAMEFKNNWVKR